MSSETETTLSSETETYLPNTGTERRVPMWEVALCSVIGSLFLVSADLVTNGTGAVTLKLAEGAALLFPHWADTVVFETVAFVLMILLGLGLCYVYRPRSRAGAFTRGSSVILVLVGINTGSSLAVTPAEALELGPRTPVSTCEPRSYGPFGLGTMLNRDAKGCWTRGVVRRVVEVDCLDSVRVGQQHFCRISLGGQSYWVQAER